MAERERRRVPDVSEYSSLRWAVSIDAAVHEAASCPLPIRIVDISTSGCRLWAGFRLTPGRSARLLLDGLAPVRGRVVWARDWYAAIGFQASLHPAVLRHLVASYPPVVPVSPQQRVARMIAPSIP